MYRTLFILIAMLAMGSCVTLPKQLQTKDEVIACGPGPEDMVMDTISEQPRLLISCTERRANRPYYGEINVYYPATGQMRILKRHEPADIHFYPHGVDLVKVKDSLILLVVNNASKYNEQSILRYRVFKDSLVFLNKIVDPLIVSPNAVSGFADGSLLITNDAKKLGNFWEVLFILKRGEIIYWDGSKCSVAAQGFCYANGITIRNKQVYMASTRQNKIWQFDMDNGKMLNKQIVAKAYGADNLRFDGNNILVACHLRYIDFLKHMKDSTHYSPTTVYRISLADKQSKVVYFDTGKQLSAGSTGLIYHNYLYAGGVFDGKIVRKKIE